MTLTENEMMNISVIVKNSLTMIANFQQY